MKVLLVGNYEYLSGHSMGKFAALLEAELIAAGHEVRLLRPRPFLGHLLRSPSGAGKWLGYFDRFFLFLPFLKRASMWAEVVHICDQANAIYVPLLRTKPHIVTCHDLLAIRSALGEFPEHQTRATGKVYQRWILRGLRRAMHIVCVSEATARDLSRIAGLQRARISLVPNALNYEYSRMSKADASPHLQALGVLGSSPFFLHVGGNYWYKNRAGLLRIFDELICFPTYRDFTLVVAGDTLNADLRRLAEKSGVLGRIQEVGRVTNKQLRALYSTAEALIFPSVAEGFGWPILEAQACGCPVFTSGRSPMTEVGGDGAVYFDPSDPKVAAATIVEALDYSASLRVAGYQNLKGFSVENMTRGYLHVYALVKASVRNEIL